jgi:hypothetical protein
MGGPRRPALLRRFLEAAVPGLVLVPLIAGCQVDDSGRGLGGAGGAGGGTTSGPPCVTETDCIDDVSICRSPVCEGGMCVMSAVNEGTACPVEMPVDVCHTVGKCTSGQCVAMPKPCSAGQMCCLPDGNCCTTCAPGCTP